MRTSYNSGDWSTEQKLGDRRRIVPIPQISDVYEAFEQDYTIERASFAPTAFNTASPDDAVSYLQSESPGIDLNNEKMKWTRGYYPVPPDWSESGTFAPVFPGFPGYIITPSNTAVRGRAPFSPPGGVDCRIYYEYFMVGAGQTYASDADIPLNEVQEFVFTDNPTIPNNSVVPAAGLNFGSQYWAPTTPTQELYKIWMTNAAALGWASTRAGTWPGGMVPNTDGQYVVQCNKERLIGNIWARITRCILAQ